MNYEAAVKLVYPEAILNGWAYYLQVLTGTGYTLAIISGAKKFVRSRIRFHENNQTAKLLSDTLNEYI